jgi:hypothetical protein
VVAIPSREPKTVNTGLSERRLDSVRWNRYIYIEPKTQFGSMQHIADVSLVL